MEVCFPPILPKICCLVHISSVCLVMLRPRDLVKLLDDVKEAYQDAVASRWTHNIMVDLGRRPYLHV